MPLKLTMVVKNREDGYCEFSIVMPCLNESKTLATCIKNAQYSLDNLNIAGEVIIADNGSTDGSQAIALKLGAHVVNVKQRGYGAALQGGFKAAHGRYIIMGDADESYDFTSLKPFVEKLREGYDLVMGNRFKGGIQPGAMPPLHKFLGNPVLTAIGRLFFRSSIRDFHCGLRGFRKEAVMHMDLRTTGMEFASEMVVKATLFDMRIAEVPTTLSPDGRSRPPHLRSWRDGWRHLRFLLLYSPRWLFLYPGFTLITAGLFVGVWLHSADQTVGNVTFGIHTLLYASLAIIIGFQAVVFAVFTKVFAITQGLLPQDCRLEKTFQHITLEVGLICGTVLAVGGLLGSLYAVHFWKLHAFGPLDVSETLRIVIPAFTSLALGCQTILSSFFLSVLGLKR